MINGTILLPISASHLAFLATIRRKYNAHTVLNRDLGPKTGVVHQISDIDDGFHQAAGRISNISFTTARPNSFSGDHAMHWLSRSAIADT
jgi:hypothetical protein